ncbi:MAG: molecular chaperone HtpG [Peptococcaceae bacterium]|nr:molecular chaperone HtpG [Peptococcaceae bacterium]
MAKKAFKAESQRLMDLMIHSIYTNREIFLRELISNASDAIDKVYYETLTDENRTFNKDDFYIRLTPNKEARTLTIEDTGVGMTAEELENNLGTIAKSGSFDFKSNQDQDDDHNIIGQFGVGFYSAFMVAKEVTVESKTWNPDEPAAMWHSDGTDGYTISECGRTTPGTKITLTLRDNTDEENYDEFLDPHLLRALVTRYSNYIRYPIVMLCEKQRMKEGTEEHPEYETYYEDDTLNSMVPIWRKNKNELKDEDYENFYHERRFGFDKPLRHIHLNAEGAALSYRAILYIPSQPPFDYYTNDYKRGLALYSNGVLIMDNCEDLLPEYYNFVKGVVDSEDLSLNISRELLQHDRQLMTIRHKIDERITRELSQMRDNDRENYEKFYKAFGRHIKISIYDSYGAHKDKLQDFLLFYSSTENKLVTLKEYVERMPEEQKYIYYATGASADQIDKLPQVGIIKKKNFEMLYLTDAFDEFVLKAIAAYDGKEFRSVSGDDLGLDDETTTEDDTTEEQNAFFEKLAGLLSDEVVRVKTTDRLADEDAVYLSTEGQISVDMEKLYAAMPNGQSIKAQKVLEINKNHPVYAKLEALYKENNEDALKEYTNLLYQQARLIAGLPVEDPTSFARSLSVLMTK